MMWIKKLVHVVGIMSMLIMGFSCRGSADSLIKAQGLVDGDVILLKSKVAGTLMNFNLIEGQPVEAGEVAGEIDSEKIRNQMQEIELNAEELQNTRAKLERRMASLRKSRIYLEKQVQRFGRLKQEEAIPGEKLESMELKLDEVLTRQVEIEKEIGNLEIGRRKLETRRQYLEILLRDHRLTVPVSGHVIRRLVTAGENLFPGSALAEILDEKSLYVELFLEAAEISALSLGNPVRVEIDGREKPLPGQIYYFGDQAEFSPKYIITEEERDSLLYRVKVRVDGEYRKYLKLGMVVSVIIENHDQSQSYQ
jgi:HlyD family secretion protein